MKLLKKLLIILPVVCGIVLFAVMKTNKKPPIRLENQERVQAVRVIPLEKMPVVPRVITYGYVAADRTWQAISEVSGKVVSVHKDLKKGYFIKKDEVLFKIDTTTYGLAETRGVADLMNVDARLKELEQSRTNTQRLLAIEKKSLASAGLELKRKRELFANQYISASDLEKEERTFLARQTTVNNLQNTLDLIPSQKKALLAQKKSGESTVTQRRLDVARTEIRAPFDCRLSVVNIELHQFAAAGTVLVEAESVDRAEIPVSLTPKSFMTLLPRNYDGNLSQMPDLETIRRAIGIAAKVTLPMDVAFPIEWEGIFSRTSESMDLKTGALTLYITVDKPYENIIPGKRPPLVTNMYVEVTLYGRLLPDSWVVPRSAVHDGTVYICTPGSRLEIRPVGVEFYMQDMAVLSGGLEQGDVLVLTDLVPAIQGMRLKPLAVLDVLETLKQQALGETK
ncbi:hypothetical protein [Desulfobacula sp.]|uniref:efflux RND transporter periplasmic adaptor subunit n=1 Tax=Desulfobacula sp. TaxID=2593537 RepID=UPI00261EC1FA|nr:hypothetical protein [Desulfobacula sp.]